MANPVRVPDDTQSIHNIGDFIMGYQPYQNAFLSALVNRIGRVIVTSRMWTNPLSVFKKGRLEFGETVEEIFANIAKPHSFDPAVAETQLYRREIPDVRAAFHSMNFQKFYKVTVTVDQLRQAFLSYGELTDLVARIVDTLYTGMQLDEYLTMKYLISREALNGGIYPITVSPIEGANANPEDAVERFREYTNELTFLKTAFNRAGVRNSTPVADQAIFIPNRPEAVIGVKVLAAAFHINEVDYISKRIALDGFTFDADDEARLEELYGEDGTYVPFTEEEKASLDSIVAVKMDKNWFMVFDIFEQFRESENGQGLYWQYFLHVWRMFSASPFANAVCFTTEETTITNVTVTPTAASASVGTSIQLTATVAGTGLYKKSVTWSISGQEASGTTIDGSSGVLVIASDETATDIVVTATAVDGTSGTATVTVS